MQAPIFLIDGLDITVHPTPARAAGYAEAIDVDAGIYRAYDATGLELRLWSDPPLHEPTSRRVHLAPTEPAHHDPATLRERLATSYGRATGQELRGALAEAVEQFVAWSGFTR